MYMLGSGCLGGRYEGTKREYNFTYQCMVVGGNSQDCVAVKGVHHSIAGGLKN